MEKDNDDQLIQDTLAGDDNAFTALVQKYQKGIHALAWRKTGDFHTAEEITQDTFLQAYRRLSTLRNPNLFAGWLYVIANRLCIRWFKKYKPPTQSLENTPVKVINDAAYSHYESQQRESDANERRQELVKKLLAKLPESERTVVTLYYLSEMTTKEISKFLGVSINTITSRLQRGRQRLQEQREETLVQETLGRIQIPADLTARIMQQIAHISPISPTVGKPVLPWAAFGTAVILVIFMLGVSSQLLIRFQKPYSFEAASEPTIEIIDVPFVLDVPAKPAIRNQFGRATTPAETNSTGTQISNATSTSASLDDATQFDTAQWSQGSAPPGGRVHNVFAASDGTLFAVSPTGMYRFDTDATTWTSINPDLKIEGSPTPIAEHQDTIYIVGVDEIFSSEDKGYTWKSIAPRPSGHTIGIVITDIPQAHNTQAPVTIYLALRDEGIFQSTNGGTQWIPLKNGVSNDVISSIAAIENTVFVGTNRGLYRLDSGVWNNLQLDTPRSVYSLAVSENNLYVGTGPDTTDIPPPKTGETFPISKSNFIKIFHSGDFGASWTDITPQKKIRGAYKQVGITVLPVGNTVLALSMTHWRSTDGGKNWTQLGEDPHMSLNRSLPATAGNDTTFYRAGAFGLHRTTDAGDSWHFFMSGMLGTTLSDLVIFNNIFYAFTGYEVYQSTDDEQSWKKVWIDDLENPFNLGSNFRYKAKWVIENGNLYFIHGVNGTQLKIYRASTDGNTLIPLQNIPVIDGKKPGSESDYIRLIPQISPESELKPDGVAVTNDVFYVEYKRRLLKWKIGDPDWTNTGFTDSTLLFDQEAKKGIKIAGAGETLYVGKRNGKLFQSFDAGNTWKDITSSLPLQYTHFKMIVFVGTSLYVATDNGVIISQNGEHWRVVTDNTGISPIIDKFVVDDNKVYGISNTGLYRLHTHGKSERITAEVPNRTNAIAIANGKLYSATFDSGIFHISLEEY